MNDQAWLRRCILRYYQHHQRPLPWRQTRDPYKIWLSEVMLQQTQVATVVPRYQQFLKQYPTLLAVADACEEDICTAFAGLGYYRRAQYLYQAARQIKEHWQGVIPAEVDQLLTLPGIGRYTAGAIASIAFNRQAPLVDGNVERVLARFFALAMPLDTTVGRKTIWDLVTKLVQGPHPGAFNQGLMELGSLVCTPKAPLCGQCGLKQRCLAYQQKTTWRYPFKKKPVSRQKIEVIYGYVRSNEGVWLSRRPLGGLWSGLWELPRLALDQAVQGKLLGTIRHLLTHRDVSAQIIQLPQSLWDLMPSQRPFAAPLAAPVSVLARKALQLALAKDGGKS